MSDDEKEDNDDQDKESQYFFQFDSEDEDLMSSTIDQEKAHNAFQFLSPEDQYKLDTNLLRDTVLEEDQTDLIRQAMSLSEIYDDDDEDDDMICFPLRKLKETEIDSSFMSEDNFSDDSTTSNRKRKLGMSGVGGPDKKKRKKRKKSANVRKNNTRRRPGPAKPQTLAQGSFDFDAELDRFNLSRPAPQVAAPVPALQAARAALQPVPNVPANTCLVFQPFGQPQPAPGETPVPTPVPQQQQVTVTAVPQPQPAMAPQAIRVGQTQPVSRPCSVKAVPQIQQLQQVAVTAVHQPHPASAPQAIRVGQPQPVQSRPVPVQSVSRPMQQQVAVKAASAQVQARPAPAPVQVALQQPAPVRLTPVPTPQGTTQPAHTISTFQATSGTLTTMPGNPDVPRTVKIRNPRARSLPKHAVSQTQLAAALQASGANQLRSVPLQSVSKAKKPRLIAPKADPLPTQSLPATAPDPVQSQAMLQPMSQTRHDLQPPLDSGFSLTSRASKAGEGAMSHHLSKLHNKAFAQVREMSGYSQH